MHTTTTTAAGRALGSTRSHTALSSLAGSARTSLRGVAGRARMLAQPARAFPEDLLNTISVALKNSPLNEVGGAYMWGSVQADGTEPASPCDVLVAVAGLQRSTTHAAQQFARMHVV